MSKAKSSQDNVEPTSPKIHLDKYQALRSLAAESVALLRARYSGKMFTESEWDQNLEHELQRTVS